MKNILNISPSSPTKSRWSLFRPMWIITQCHNANTQNNNVKVGIYHSIVKSGNTKGGSITVLMTSCLTGLESVVGQLTIFFCKTDQFKPVKQEINGTVILPPLVFPG